MTSILVGCVLYIIWCMRGAGRFLRENSRKPGKTSPSLKENDNK